MIKLNNLQNKVLKNKPVRNHAQMVLLAGITISTLIIIMASIPVYLSNIDVSISFDKNTNILNEYLNVRDTFIKVFNKSCAGHNDYITISDAFNYTKNTLTNIEMRYGNYFDANIIKISNYKSNYLNATVELKLICKETTIEEKINIPIWIYT